MLNTTHQTSVTDPFATQPDGRRPIPARRALAMSLLLWTRLNTAAVAAAVTGVNNDSDDE